MITITLDEKEIIEHLSDHIDEYEVAEHICNDTEWIKDKIIGPLEKKLNITREEIISECADQILRDMNLRGIEQEISERVLDRAKLSFEVVVKKDNQ